MYMQNVYPHKRNTNVTVGDMIFRIGDGGFIVNDKDEPFDVPEEYALRLLQGRAWKELDWDPADPKNKNRFASHNQPKSQGRGRPPRSRTQMEVEYGANLPKDPIDLLKGQVTPTATHTDPEAQKALGMTPDKGQVSDARLERLAKADSDQVAKSTKLAGSGKEADTTMASALGSLGSGEAAIGDGRKPGQGPEATAAPPPPPTRVFKGKKGQTFTIPADGDWPDPTTAMPMDYLREMAKAYEVKHNSRTTQKTLMRRINGAMYPEVE